jgi:site-specific DNA-methyltransferase (adenine-specific)
MSEYYYIPESNEPEMKKYKVIYADPPWHYGSKSAVNNSTGSNHKPLSDHYNTMSLAELKSLPISKMTEKDAACFMWVTDSHLDEAIELFKAWGFKYKTVAFNWVKTTSKGNYCKNVAPWTMKSSEICLLGTKGAMTKYKQVNNIESLVIAERTKHSRKPEEVRRRIELLFGDTSRLEMFAREKTKGWDVFGNEVDNSINI